MNTQQHTQPNTSKWTLLVAIAAVTCLGLISCSTTHSSYSGTYPTGTYYQTTYTPPSWAPMYANVSNVRYYYLPDCDVYYDASTQQFYSLNSGTWTPSSTVPSNCANLDLNNAYTVLLNSNGTQPWLNDASYRINYPVHSYDQYGNIVATYNLLPNIPTGDQAVARGFDENTNRVIFIERNPVTSTYVYQSIPMSSISPYMPPESRTYYYGGGYPSR